MVAEKGAGMGGGVLAVRVGAGADGSHHNRLEVQAAVELGVRASS